MLLYSPGILKFYNKLEDQLRRKSYSEGKTWPLVCELGNTPPWQIVTEDTSITTLEIIELSTGTTYDILNGALDAGLVSEDYTDNGQAITITVLPGKAPMPDAPTTPGEYYIKLSGSGGTVYSEVFKMCDDLTPYHKIVWCNSENLSLPVGWVMFESPNPGTVSYNFDFFIYVKTEIAKPKFQYEVEVEKRDGKNFPLKQTRWKEQFFELILPEAVLDGLTLAPLHDTITILTATGETLQVDEMSIEQDWMEQGDVAAVTVMFRTDTVVVISGRGLTSAVDCAPPSGTCFSNDYVAVAQIDEGSAEHAGGYYVDDATGSNISFADGDYIVIKQLSGQYGLYKFSSGPTYTPVTTMSGDNIFEQNTGRYFQNSGGVIITNEITSVTISGPTIQGTAINPGTVSLYAILYSGESLLGIIASNDFTGLGFDFQPPLCIKGVRMEVANGVCGTYYTGDTWSLGVFDVHAPVGNYDNTQEAIAAGVLPGQIYALTAANDYGLPEGIVLQVPPLDGGGHINKASGEAAVGKDCMFALREDNEYGMPEGALMMVPDATPVYTSDANAGAGGVLIERIYAYDGTTDGLPYVLIKKRIT